MYILFSHIDDILGILAVYFSFTVIIVCYDDCAYVNLEFTMQLYVHDEKFHQPIFYCNNIAGRVEPVSSCNLCFWFVESLETRAWSFCCCFQVVPDNENRALYSTHSFKILFKEGGCGTFVPLFFNLIGSVRRYNQNIAAQPRIDPLQAAQTPVDEMMRHAYVSLSVLLSLSLQSILYSAIERRAFFLFLQICWS